MAMVSQGHEMSTRHLGILCSKLTDATTSTGNHSTPKGFATLNSSVNWFDIIEVRVQTERGSSTQVIPCTYILNFLDL
jgi:hypothetical protein